MDSVHGLQNLILLRCHYYPKCSAGPMQSLPKFQWHFFEEIEKVHLKFLWNVKGALKQPKQSWKKWTKLAVSHFVILKLTANPKSPKQCCTGITTDT